MIDRIKNEPVLVTTLVGCVLSLLVSFGLDISHEQKAASIAVVVAILALVARSRVTPSGGE